MGPAFRVLVSGIPDGGKTIHLHQFISNISAQVRVEIRVALVFSGRLFFSLFLISLISQMPSCACTSALIFSKLQSPVNISILAPASALVYLQQYTCVSHGFMFAHFHRAIPSITCLPPGAGFNPIL